MTALGVRPVDPWPKPVRPVPRAHPALVDIEAAHARAEAVTGWTIRAARAAPTVPFWLIAGVATLLANEAAGADVLLIAADAVEAMAAMARADGEARVSAELHALADLPRELAPLRAGGR